MKTKVTAELLTHGQLLDKIETAFKEARERFAPNFYIPRDLIEACDQIMIDRWATDEELDLAGLNELVTQRILGWLRRKQIAFARDFLRDAHSGVGRELTKLRNHNKVEQDQTDLDGDLAAEFEQLCVILQAGLDAKSQDLEQISSAFRNLQAAITLLPERQAKRCAKRRAKRAKYEAEFEEAILENQRIDRERMEAAERERQRAMKRAEMERRCQEAQAARSRFSENVA